jgi:glycosyltransferase involved in cell wall biosynthesis
MDKEIPDVSVIVPVYNAERFFEKCLRSLFEQTLENMEYIFVNDCTPDNSMLILESVLEKYPKRKTQVLILNHDRNMGSGATRKDGMKSATGKYVIHCDSDDWIEITMYERMYKKAIEEDADIVCCGFYEEYHNKSIEKIYRKGNGKDLLRNLEDPTLYSVLWNKLINRDLYVRHNVYPFEGVNMGEDLGVTVRLLYLSTNTIVMHESLYHYNKQNVSSLVSDYKSSFIEECILCSKYIEDFFFMHNVHSEYYFLIQQIKFRSKCYLLLNKKSRNIERWRNTFPETHKYLLKYKSLSLRSRVFYLLVLKFPVITNILLNIIDKVIVDLFSKNRTAKMPFSKKPDSKK